MTTKLTPMEETVLDRLIAADEPIPSHALVPSGKGIAARSALGRRYVQNLRGKGIEIDATGGRGYYLPWRWQVPLPSPIVVVDSEPMLAILTAMYDAMWRARARKVAA